jgi:hypothetical protein
MLTLEYNPSKRLIIYISMTESKTGVDLTWSVASTSVAPEVDLAYMVQVDRSRASH